MKNLSTRFTVVSRAKGGSAIDKASYISREELFSEFDGTMHRPDKTTEDLVHAEVSLPDNAPSIYLDRETLWNSVELVEKQKNVQLCRMMKASLPNSWTTGKELEELCSSMMTIRKTASEIISDMNTEIAMSQHPLEQIEDKEELALQVGDKYLAIQKCDEGYDYTFYDGGYHGLDGGVIENPDAPIAIVATEVIAAEGLGGAKPVKEVDYDKLQEDAAYTAAYEMEAIAEKKPSILGQLKDKFGLVKGKHEYGKVKQDRDECR